MRHMQRKTFGCNPFHPPLLPKRDFLEKETDRKGEEIGRWPVDKLNLRRTWFFFLQKWMIFPNFKLNKKSKMLLRNALVSLHTALNKNRKKKWWNQKYKKKKPKGERGYQPSRSFKKKTFGSLSRHTWMVRDQSWKPCKDGIFLLYVCVCKIRLT